VGSLDIEKALHEGIKALEPGILAQANRNILYIDEINLLDDNLVDVLLDAAAYGVNIIEREGISISHPSKFILVGTMNPEEGELRGQLSDRIGLEIEVEAISDIGDRILIMKRREDFEKDPVLFNKNFENDQKSLQSNIAEARKILVDVEIDDISLEIIAKITVELGSEGHRSDISILKTAKTIAAFNGRLKVNDSDLEESISLVLGDNISLSGRIQKIKKDIEIREENLKEGISEEKINETAEEFFKEKFRKINEKLDQNVPKGENHDKNKGNTEYIDLGDSELKKSNTPGDSDSKAEGDLGSDINEGDRIENFNETESEEGKIDIKKL
jgi:Mg-chelatase subunit ChlI